MAIAEYKVAIQRDTRPEFKAKYIASATDLAKRLGNKQASAELAYIIYTTKKNPVNTPLYNWGFPNYSAGNYKTADSILCEIYTSKYPPAIYGHLCSTPTTPAHDASLTSH